MNGSPPFNAVQGALELALGPLVGISVTNPCVKNHNLWPEEEPAIARAVPKRKLEFSAGRTAIRNAMRSIGPPECAVPVASDRTPILPDTIVGSISHTDTICAAAVGRSTDWRGIGIDLEICSPMDDNIIQTVLTASERAQLDLLEPAQQSIAVLRIFSAKECAFKAQYAMTKAMFGFECMQITFSQDTFQARFCNDFAPFQTGDVLIGTSAIVGDHVVSTVKIPH